MKQAYCRRSLFAVPVALLLAQTAAAGPLDPPDAVSLERARAIVEKMIGNDRGPYARIRWFCRDGTVLPPEPYACRPHGGGRQHAQYSDERAMLAGMGYSVGTIVAALDFDELFDADRRHARLRELPVEQYLVDTQDGWVLRRARFYRGRVQVEDEQAAGTALLLRLLADGDWVGRHYLLAREAVRTIPHASDGDLTRDVRRLSQLVAEARRSFEPLRIEVHTRPVASTAERVRDWIDGQAGQPVGSGVLQDARVLADKLDQLFGAPGRAARLDGWRRQLAGDPATEILARLLGDASRDETSTTDHLARALEGFRAHLVGDSTAKNRLLLFDAMNDVEAELRIVADERLANDSLTRGELASLATNLVRAAFGVGLFSPGERDVLLAALDPLTNRSTIGVDAYRDSTGALDRGVGWSVQTVRYTFAEPLIRYGALEPSARGFVDDLLRSSPMLPLANASRRLSQDSQQYAGIHRSIDGQPAPYLLALNPGVATGVLRVLDDDALTSDGQPPARTDVVVLPQTVSELPPVAGLLTGGEGNLLSHVQLLARNFGIPNVSVAGQLPAAIRALDGQHVLLAVDRAGSVVLVPTRTLDADLLASLAPGGTRDAVPDTATVDVPDPDLGVRRPLPIDKLGRALSGKVVGPKAANLGELHRLFPRRVEPAIALPFGLFETHVATGDPSLRRQIDAAYRDFRAGRIDETGLAERLASIRGAIRALRLDTETRDALVPMMASLFGEPGTYGVFVRSDTNVEDLPGFTGAGLNETVPNVVGLDAQLAAVPQVWSSILSPRAVAWRSRILRQPEKIYASVLLMKSVPAAKSGVLVTMDLETRERGLTVSTAWGVGGAVGGEQAESIVLLPDGREKLLSEAKTPYRRTLVDTGGVVWQPAYDGPVLTADEKTALRSLARDAQLRLQTVRDADGRKLPWDIEFGFVDGELALFQVRPLVERGADRAARVIAEIAPSGGQQRARRVDLEQPPRDIHTGHRS